MSDRLAFVRDYVAKKPTDRFGLYTLGMELRKVHQWVECFTTFETLLGLHAGNGPAYYAYGMAKKESGDRPGAAVVWRRGLEAIGNTDPKTHAELEEAIESVED